MKNKKLFISFIIFIAILLFTTVCHAATIEYDISDYSNHLAGKHRAIIYSKRDDCIYMIAAWNGYFGVSNIETDYTWYSSRAHYYEMSFGNVANGVSVLTYDPKTKTFTNETGYKAGEFSSGKDTVILATESEIGIILGNEIKDAYWPENNIVSVERGTSDSGGSSSGSESGGTSSGDNGNTSTDFSSTGVFSWIAKGFSDIGNFFEKVIKGISTFGESVDNWFKSLTNDLGNWFSKLGSDIGGFFSKLGTDIGNFFNKLGLDIMNFFAGIPEFFANFWNTLNNFFTDLFVPSVDVYLSIQDTIMSKFGFVQTIKNTINQIKETINNVEESPTLYVTVSETKYTKAGDVKILDLSWYANYKKYGDLVISGFVYLFYAWRIFTKLPGIIVGTSAGVETVNSLDRRI